jgi:hypothetical protein
MGKSGRYSKNLLKRRSTASNDFETLGQTSVRATGWVNYTIGAKQSIRLGNREVYGAYVDGRYHGY